MFSTFPQNDSLTAEAHPAELLLHSFIRKVLARAKDPLPHPALQLLTLLPSEAVLRGQDLGTILERCGRTSALVRTCQTPYKF